MTVEQNNDRIAQCVSMLRDDYERQSGYLNFDDVSRIMSRRNLAPEEVSAVWIGLDQIGIVVDGLNVPKEVVAIAPPPTEDNVSFPNDYPRHELLNSEDEIQLSRRIRTARSFQETSDSIPDESRLAQVLREGEKARNTLILSNIRLAIHCAKEFESKTALELEDLIQEGILGLFKAAQKYDPERGYRFSTYAIWWIKQAIRRAIDVKGRIIRIPCHAADRLRTLRGKRRQLSSVLRRKPTPEEIAFELGWDIGDVELLLQHEKDIYSLDSSQKREQDRRMSDSLTKAETSPARLVEGVELYDLIQEALSTLNERSRDILILRFGLNGQRPLTLKAVGEKYGLTRERIRQIEQRALERIATTARGTRLRQYIEGKET